MITEVQMWTGQAALHAAGHTPRSWKMNQVKGALKGSLESKPREGPDGLHAAGQPGEARDYSGSCRWRYRQLADHFTWARDCDSRCGVHRKTWASHSKTARPRIHPFLVCSYPAGDAQVNMCLGQSTGLCSYFLCRTPPRGLTTPRKVNRMTAATTEDAKDMFLASFIVWPGF